MKGRARFRLGKEPPNESSENAADDSEHCRHDQPHTLCARHDCAGDQTDNETNNDVPNNMYHRFLRLDVREITRPARH